nr:uncharacterized protein LOC113805943 isoform X3 [Penaeus vannamei]
MADLRILLLVSLLSLPPGQGEGPCLDELYVEGSESCMDVSGLQPMKWRSSKNYLEIQSSKPLWFSFDCINASHIMKSRAICSAVASEFQVPLHDGRHFLLRLVPGCRFHRLIKVVFVPGENGLVTWRPEGQAFKLEAGIRAYGRVDYIEPGKRSYDIAIHGSSAGPLCGISCPSLNLNFMSAAYCGHPMVIISVNKRVVRRKTSPLHSPAQAASQRSTGIKPVRPFPYSCAPEKVC